MERSARPGLTRATVAAAALDLLDEVGLDRLSVRRLADVLGVKSPALYWHFQDKAELLDLMAQELLRPTELPPAATFSSWQHWAAEHARRRRQTLLTRRDGARLVVGTRPGPEIAVRAENDMNILVAAGFTPVEALRALVALGHYVTGFVIEEQAALQRRELRSSPRDEQQGVDTPTLRAALEDGGAPENDDAFEHGLRALIRGLDDPALHDAAW